jgi:nicotinamide-nucleotide amidase
MDVAAVTSDLPTQLWRSAQQLGGLLQRERLMLATAESCTAGGIAFAVTQIPGSSGWFDRGFITYSNDSKLKVLGVSPVYLRDYGAVSEPVARSMALGCLNHSAAQVAVAVTGIAGPDGGTESKPVGTVCFAWAIRRDPTVAPWVRTTTRLFDGDRAAVRTQGVLEALDGLNVLLEQRLDV